MQIPERQVRAKCFCRAFVVDYLTWLSVGVDWITHVAEPL